MINCGGTWADKILGMASEKDLQVHKIKRSEGIHIITKKIAGNHVVSIQREDGGHMMIMPWRDHSLIGTTDREYTGDPDDYRVSRESVNDIIEAVNHHYGRKLSFDDVTHAYGGSPSADRRPDTKGLTGHQGNTKCMTMPLTASKG
ncbi:MAG: FAD-dependent oxidoreductase [Marinilabiliales bacterium]|nr:FAD-dependent oxidoreductase [Marinilabiliales bacterium]